ncbi:hypothetical protein D9619_012966 [Psilocybe cf. subviscida]|uniref:Nephrocystin 3-like N-terminal domain-containing protein n=1 Tax=Psilocybe cf. subviscida TaxID=2480587 RepID=A0A8H5F506_9AGAR|nr:hypothetical protein D9619_012966 [Psilocybe cf. subviscida]
MIFQTIVSSRRSLCAHTERRCSNPASFLGHNMANMGNSIISTNSERQRGKWLDPSAEVERGINRLKWRIPADVMPSVSPRHEPTDLPTSLAENTLQRLSNWLAEPPGSGSNILWLSGVPVSFDTDDIIPLCHGRCILAASFSFSSRKGSEQAEKIAPTMALQICSNIPHLRPIVGLTAFHYPNIFSGGLHVQLEALIFNPFRQYASMEECGLPPVLIIDGLELYHDVKTQRNLISSIETTAATSSIPLRFLLTSRRGTQDYELSLRPGTHLHVHNGPTAPALHKLQSAFRPNTSQRANTLPYHGFPKLLQTQSSISDAESYTRSLIMLGHGVPLWRPRGNLVAPSEYLRHGPQIGDIMHITREGVYQFVINIFCRHDEPINSKMDMQGQYQPLTLDPSEVTRVENYWKPGAVITSTGVVAVKQCDTPLTINFKSTAKEGALLVLPEGASREDITSTKRFHKYVQRWAPHWYRHLGLSNGSIFLVTGCDKASDFACATFFSDDEPREIDMDYVRHENDEYPWNNQGRARAHYYRHSDAESDVGSTSIMPEHTQRFCVFIRGMRIALSSAVWSSYNTSTIAQNSVAYTNVLHKPPLLGHATDSLLVRLHCRTREELHLQIFHPIFALGPDLFHKHPKASTVIVNDSDWSMLTREGHGDWTHMKTLIDKFYQHFVVVEENGVVFLSRRTQPDQKDMNASRGVTLARLFRRNDGPAKMIPICKFVHNLGEIPDT